MASAAKKPATDEKTTLIDNLIFVIDLKSDTAIAIEENEDLDCNLILFTSILSAQRYFIITIYQCKIMIYRLTYRLQLIQKIRNNKRMSSIDKKRPH